MCIRDRPCAGGLGGDHTGHVQRRTGRLVGQSQQYVGGGGDVEGEQDADAGAGDGEVAGLEVGEAEALARLVDVQGEVAVRLRVVRQQDLAADDTGVPGVLTVLRDGAEAALLVPGADDDTDVRVPEAAAQRGAAGRGGRVDGGRGVQDQADAVAVGDRLVRDLHGLEVRGGAGAFADDEVGRGLLEDVGGVGRQHVGGLGEGLRLRVLGSRGALGGEDRRLAVDDELGLVVHQELAVPPLDLAGGRLRLEGGLPLGEVDEVVVAVGRGEGGYDAQARAETGRDTGAEALGHDTADLLEEFTAVVVGGLEETAAAEALHHLDAQPAPEDLVAGRTGLGVLLDDVEGLAQVLEVADGVEALEAGVRGVLALDVVVADVVAEHGDVVRGEVGLRHEDVVLKTPTAFREPQVDAVEEGAAEHLVRGEAVHQRRGRDRRVRVVLAEQLHGHGAALAGHLADDDVGAVGHAVVVHPLQGLVAEVVVVVDEHDELALGRGDADVPGLARPARGLLVDDVHVGVLGGDLVEPRGSAVRRAVVDEDRLVLIVGQRLPEERGDAILDVRPWVVHRDDDTDLYRHPATSPLVCAARPLFVERRGGLMLTRSVPMPPIGLVLGNGLPGVGGSQLSPCVLARSSRTSAEVPVSPSRGKIRSMLWVCATVSRSLIASVARVTW